MAEEEEDLSVKIVRQMARKRVVGGHNKTIDTVKNWFASSDQGEVVAIVDDLLSEGTVIERYGGQRDAIRLVSMAAARGHILERGGDLPWCLREDS
jgi:hypothetical protein